MIQITSLTLRHKKDLRVMIENFSLVLNQGDKAAIIGEEGDGKSTLLKWIYSPSLVENYAEYTGSIRTGGEKLCYLPQELPRQEAEKTVYEFFAEGEFFYDTSPKDLAALARQFGVEKDFFYREQKMAALSGGEKIKAQLMKILISQPTALLLDEPSNDIDIDTLRLLEDIINQWDKIVLFISHDETLINACANRIIHIEQTHRKTRPKHTISRLGYDDYIAQRRFLFDRQARQAENDRREKKIRDEKYRKVMQSVEHALKTATRQDPTAAKNLKDKMHTVKSMGRRFAKRDENMTRFPRQEEAILLKFNSASPLPAGKTVLDFSLPLLTAPGEEQRVLSRNISLTVKGREKVCIVGKNGAGKTSLLKQIASQLRDRPDIKAEYMPQNYEELLDLDKTPVDFLNTSGDSRERKEIMTYLGSLKYTSREMEHPVRRLSGGQKAKLLLLKMSLSGANVLILDEPTRNFSPLSAPVIRQMLASFPGAIISTSHDRKYIREVCDKVYELTEEGLQIAEISAE